MPHFSGSPEICWERLLVDLVDQVFARARRHADAGIGRYCDDDRVGDAAAALVDDRRRDLGVLRASHRHQEDDQQDEPACGARSEEIPRNDSRAARRIALVVYFETLCRAGKRVAVPELSIDDRPDNA